MSDQPIRFNDGAGYERMMGVWSRLAGDIFLDWLGPRTGARWIDIGCGNGAFTELIVDRFAPAEVQGVDPSEGQLAFARTRPAARVANFSLGDAMALAFDDDRFDAAVMALVIFFVPNPAKGVAEMVRVVRPGGLIAAYAWDMPGGGFPLEPIQAELRALGVATARPPNAAVSRIDAMRELWAAAGLDAVETREITVERSFVDFAEFWTVSTLGSTIGPAVAAMAPANVERLKDRVRKHLAVNSAGRVTYRSRANAVKGRVPT